MEADLEPAVADTPGILDVPAVHTAPILSIVRDPDPAPGAEIPRATYRVQLNKSFTFKDITEIIPYLASLGISHVYCSPYFKARAGSAHGYDVVDPTRRPAARCIRQTGEAIARVALAPLAHSMIAHSQIASHRLVGHPIRAALDNAHPLCQSLRSVPTPQNRRQFLLLRCRQRNRAREA